MSDVSPENIELVRHSVGILKLICKELNNDELKNLVSKLDYVVNMQNDQVAQVMVKQRKLEFTEITSGSNSKN